MNGSRGMFWCLCLALFVVFGNFVRAEHGAKDSNDALRFNVSRGVTLDLANDEAKVTLRLSSLLKGTEMETRNTGRPKLKKDLFKKIGMAMMMAPLMMQLLSLPATLASIKMSLLRSILVGKIALAVMLYNSLRNSQKSEVVLVHKPEYHEHYYHSYHRPEDDDDEDWWGRRMEGQLSK